MRGCYHNEILALHNRYLRETAYDVTYDDDLITKIVDELCQILVPEGELEPLTLEQFLESRTGYSKKRYVKAVQDVTRTGFDLKKDSDIGLFVKLEKFSEMKAPRVIMGRNPKFNLLYGCYTIPLEKRLLKHKTFAKGRDYFGRGEFMAKYCGTHRFIMNDYTKFESTQRRKLLCDVELGIWRRVLSPDHYKQVEKLFWAKYQKKGRSTNGVSFFFKGLRGSGDMDTGLFNTIINWVACRYFELKNGSGEHDFMVDGDDSVIAVPLGFEPTNTFTEFGLEAKLEITDDPTSVEFCSAKFVEYYPGKYLLCPDIKKICRNIGTLLNKDFFSCVGHYYYTLGFMYKVLFPGVQFFEKLSAFLMKITQNEKLRVNLDCVRDLNPTFVDAFRADHEVHQVSEDLLTPGIWLAFGLQQSQLDHLYEQMDSSLPDVTGRDKRFNKRGKPCINFASHDLATLQRDMESTLLDAGAPDIDFRVR
jgi:hypothetical protein